LGTVVSRWAGGAAILVHAPHSATISPTSALGGGGCGDWTEIPLEAGKTAGHSSTSSCGIVGPSGAIGGVDRLNRAVVAAGASRAAGLCDPALGATVATSVAVGRERGVEGAVLADGADQAVPNIIPTRHVVVRTGGARERRSGVGRAVETGGAAALFGNYDIHIGVHNHVGGQGSLELGLADIDIHPLDLKINCNFPSFTFRERSRARRGHVPRPTRCGRSGTGWTVGVGRALNLCIKCGTIVTCLARLFYSGSHWAVGAYRT
jgi:hypothetical protein